MDSFASEAVPESHDDISDHTVKDNSADRKKDPTDVMSTKS